MPVAILIERALPVDANFLVVLLFHGLLRNKTPWLSLPPKRNIFRRGAAALNYYG
jgi:hypothetical protein